MQKTKQFCAFLSQAAVESIEMVKSSVAGAPSRTHAMCLLRIAGHSALNGDPHIALAVHAKEVPAQ